ncbi:MAG: citrate/2-methylcitrate synthase [Candidatus Omnitrophica bacterium]|nr:citrate/2-methylcitrate synthase [Candidatus Omnitrophota bacterium]MCF7894036.1 citrate/2-methylcitrate synthase [Candidatus Omnitrophota bacterium]
MNKCHKKTKEITEIILKAKKKATSEVDTKAESEFVKNIKWPVDCVVGPGLEGAIACESKVGYVNGSKGWLVYRGYDIFELCAHSSFEEVSYLLLYGKLPSENQFNKFKEKLIDYRNIPKTIRLLSSFPVQEMNAMGALRLGTNLMRQECTFVDREEYKPGVKTTISADEDSIPMETRPMGERKAIYSLKRAEGIKKPSGLSKDLHMPVGFESALHLISGIPTIAGAVARLRAGELPLNPDPELSHAANLIYMLTGRRPSAIEERIMDIALILHADHGMNASTFATMVVASTLSDLYFAIGSGVAALNGSLHGGANERVINMLAEIGSSDNVKKWYKKKREKKEKISGFGHRVYKAYDPRARVLGPLANFLVKSKNDSKIKDLLKTAKNLEGEVVASLGKEKKIFPNVDFYSGIVYSCLDIPTELFTPIFAVSRASGWTARVLEYLKNNRIFRPRAVYSGPLDEKYTPISKRK